MDVDYSDSGDEMEALEVDESDDEGETEVTEENSEASKQDVYMPGQPLEDGEELVHDSTAYHMYHAAQTGSPCLSFDVLRDSLGDGRTDFPMTVYLVAGTQSELSRQNSIILMKMSQLRRTSQDDADDDDDDNDETLDDEEPQLDTVMLQHNGAINRLRAAAVTEHRLVATWSDKGVVNIWDTSKHVILLDSPSAGGGSGGATGKNPLSGHKEKPLYSFSGHQTEGFALDWSSTVPGRLATGDCSRNIHLWSPTDEGSWHVDQRPYSGHTQSVEDIQWSPNEPSVFASCSVDQTVRIWDCRAAPSKACMITTHAHDSDVNVISWNKSDPFIVSGGDDGVLKIWDLRQFKKGEAAAVFKHHSGPITSVEWHPDDSTVFASAGEDNQAVQWDLAVETESGDSNTPQDVPPQLLFIHQGQNELKELHWHPQCPGVLISTALSGFNIFKTISV